MAQVLLGARDEASISLSEDAKAAIKTLGASLIDQLSFRAAYALVGVKGGTALAEHLTKTTEGYAVAVGQMKVIISVDANKPVCDTTAPTPPVTGYVSQGNLNLDTGCRYNLFETSHATECLQGSWIVMTGSSNTLLEFGNLINFLSPDEYAIERDGESIGASAVADVVIEHLGVHLGQARFENCPNYYPSCLDGPRCEKWECMNSVPCTLKAEDPPMAGNTEGLCSDAVNISAFLTAAEAPEAAQMADACHNAQGLRVRLWCNASLEFLLPLLALLAAITLKVVIYFREKRQAASAESKKGLAKEKEFMGSTHVVVGHLFAKGVTEPIYFFGWGFTWEETMVQYVLRRSTTIYPLYAFSLIPAFIIGKAYGTMAAEWPTLLAQSFLMQAWVPHFTENALQMHCWFLSCMVVYWFFFKPLSHVLKDITLLKKTCLLMGFFFFLPWLLVFIPLMASTDVDWYKDSGNHDFYATDTFLDIGVVMLKFHPICYFHVFILGMLLAKLRQLLDKKAVASPHGCFSWRNPFNVALQFVAPLGYFVLFLVFSVQEFQAKSWGYKLSARISVLLPFQAMILFGLAGFPSLPLPIFSHIFSKMDFLENYSYAAARPRSRFECILSPSRP
eukprot:Skav228530  [mRNA]  locus=scaffold796:328991:351330:+ [translate_table: standard]